MAHYPASYAGPYWKMIHFTALRLDEPNIPKATRTVLWEYLNQLEHHLPCQLCVDSLRGFLREHPLPETNIFAWSVECHNHANQATGRPPINLENARKYVEQDWAPKHSQKPEQPKNVSWMLPAFLGTLLMFAIIIILFLKINKNV